VFEFHPVGALGVVFGDIGTSPLYTVQTVFSPSDPHPVTVSHGARFRDHLADLLVGDHHRHRHLRLLVMRADNDGEGGIMALITLIRKRGSGGVGRTKLVLAALGIFGASLFFGDSMITPAISVLSAVEGVKVAEPSVSDLVIPITVGDHHRAVPVPATGHGRRGTPVRAGHGRLVRGSRRPGRARHRDASRDLEGAVAHLRHRFLAGHFGTAFFSLTAVVLAVTGAEALYADMGHFGRAPIRRAWLLAVFPACILNYLGQGALILGHHDTISNPFFLLAPGWARLPMVFLATVATVIASQAVITGAYSVAHQAAGLGYLPRLRISTPRKRRWARSTFRGSTGCCWSPCSPSSSPSGAQTRWPTPTARP
jgi:KUP system potassium uptake protein